MAAEPTPEPPVTEDSRLEHLVADVHEILRLLHEFATPEARAALASFLSNPAVKWKARRNASPGT